MTLRIFIGILLALGLWAAPAHAQGDSGADRMDLKKIAEDVYFMENSRGSSNGALADSSASTLARILSA